MLRMFTLLHQDNQSHARAGIIHTDHGDIETPIFMPVGTQATVKSLATPDLEAMDAQIILANTYHLHLRPGEELIDRAGGLHTFMNWPHPMLTDSGGFQVFSLGAQMAEKGSGEKLAKIDDNGVTFRSHIDGSTHRFTPEIAIDIQHKLGADIIMAFDECTPDNADEAYTLKAMDRTHRWAKESLDAHKKNTKHHGYNQYLFGIIQGANHKDLRIESAKAICDMDFDGIAVGGESIGYNMQATKDILDWIAPYLPKDKPRYTMGVGHSPMDLFDVVERGIDMFDCVSPTRIARNGQLFTKDASTTFKLNITRSAFKEDTNPIDHWCTCSTCQNHDRRYLHHLFKANELLAYRLASVHNLHFLLQLMQEMREAIKADKFLELKQKWLNS